MYKLFILQNWLLLISAQISTEFFFVYEEKETFYNVEKATKKSLCVKNQPERKKVEIPDRSCAENGEWMSFCNYNWNQKSVFNSKNHLKSNSNRTWLKKFKKVANLETIQNKSIFDRKS